MCWQLAQDHGLAIATLMQAAQRDIVERERFAARVDAGMAGARTTAAMLAGLPLLGIGLGQLIGAEPVRFLLSGGSGGWLLVIGVALACAGLLWSDRITARVSDMSWAALLLAAALLIGADSRRADPGRVRRPCGARRRSTPRGPAIRWPRRPASTCSRRACARGWPCRRPRRRPRRLLPPHWRRLLSRAADLLALGAEPATAWTSPDGTGRQACRSAVAAGPAVGVVGSGAGAGSCGAGRPVTPRRGRRRDAPPPSGRRC